MIEFSSDEVKEKFLALPKDVQQQKIESFLLHLKDHEVLVIQNVNYFGNWNKFLEIEITIKSSR